MTDPVSPAVAVSDEMVRAYNDAERACWLKGTDASGQHFGANPGACCQAAGIAAVRPLIEADLRQQLDHERDLSRRFATEIQRLEARNTEDQQALRDAMGLADRVRELEAERVELLELHYADPSRLGNDGTYCGHCGDEWPCQTAVILLPPTDGSTDD